MLNQVPDTLRARMDYLNSFKPKPVNDMLTEVGFLTD